MTTLVAAAAVVSAAGGFGAGWAVGRRRPKRKKSAWGQLDGVPR